MSEGIKSSTDGHGTHSGPGGSVETHRGQDGPAPFEAARQWA